MKKLIAVAVFAAAAPAWAATAAEPVVGERVRARIQNGDGSRMWVTGRLMEADAGSLMVQPAKGEPVMVPLARVERFDRSRGRRSGGKGALRGAAFGLASGAVLGAAVGALGTDTSPSPACQTPPSGDAQWMEAIACGLSGGSRGEGAALGAVLVGATGAVVGAVVGGIAPGERWERAEPGALRLSVMPTRGGVGARLTLSF